MDAATGVLTWVKGDRKTSLLFTDTLHKLAEVYAGKTVHVVLDNFKIHDSKASRSAVESLGGKIDLHFLPPYCPDHNRIERTWLDLHANVTRNHKCRDMNELMRKVCGYLNGRNAKKRAMSRRAA
jgi:transposase